MSEIRISIHAPHEGERLAAEQPTPEPTPISIHAPHEGERPVATVAEATKKYFNPRSPRGGATGTHVTRLRVWIISIHAPHEGERL